jgi:hypothetical protein
MYASPNIVIVMKIKIKDQMARTRSKNCDMSHGYKLLAGKSEG